MTLCESEIFPFFINYTYIIATCVIVHMFMCLKNSLKIIKSQQVIDKLLNQILLLSEQKQLEKYTAK